MKKSDLLVAPPNFLKILGSEGYDYDESKGLLNEDYFYGLALDEDNESDLTFQRVEKWVQQIKQSLNIATSQGVN